MTEAGEGREVVPLREAVPAFHSQLSFAFGNTLTWMVGLGTPMVLLAGQLGASTFQVGLAYAFVYLLLPIQIVATAALPRWGYRTIALWSWGTRGLFMLIPLGLALAAPTVSQPWMAQALVFSLFGFTFIRSIGMSGLNTWQFALVREEVRGRYFATEQLVISLAGILTLLTCSLLFKALPVFEAFSWQYGIALLGSLTALVSIARWPDIPRPASTSVGAVIRAAPVLGGQPGPFRQYLGFAVIYNLVSTSFGPFIAYYLKIEQGLSNELILIFSALQYGGSVGAALILRRRQDAWGVRATFRRSCYVMGAIAVFWLGLLWRGEMPVGLLTLSFCALGISGTLWQGAHMSYLPRVCPPENSALMISVHAALAGLVGGLSPVMWGLILKEGGPNPGMRTGPFAVFSGAGWWGWGCWCG